MRSVVLQKFLLLGLGTIGRKFVHCQTMSEFYLVDVIKARPAMAESWCKALKKITCFYAYVVCRFSRAFNLWIEQIHRLGRKYHIPLRVARDYLVSSQRSRKCPFQVHPRTNQYQ
jgi:hypothetical protein